jgi:hypothetical protein
MLNVFVGCAFDVVTVAHIVFGRHCSPRLSRAAWGSDGAGARRMRNIWLAAIPMLGYRLSQRTG